MLLKRRGPMSLHGDTFVLVFVFVILIRPFLRRRSTNTNSSSPRRRRTRNKRRISDTNTNTNTNAPPTSRACSRPGAGAREVGCVRVGVRVRDPYSAFSQEAEHQHELELAASSAYSK